MYRRSSRIHAVLLLVALSFIGCKERTEISTSTTGAQPSTTSSNSTQYHVIQPEAGQETFEIRPGSGFKINVEYPWKVEFKTATNGTITTPIVKKSDGIALDEKKATIPVPVKSAGEGPVEIDAVASFSVCNDDVCKNFRDEAIKLTLNSTDTATQ